MKAGVRLAGLLLVALAIAQWAQGAGVSVRNVQGGGVNLSDDDDSGGAPPAAAVAAPVAAAAPVGMARAPIAGASAPAKAASAPARGASAAAERPNPLQMHRDAMVQQAEPGNYLNANPAVSRRYLMVDQQTYQQRLQQQQAQQPAQQ